VHTDDHNNINDGRILQSAKTQMCMVRNIDLVEALFFYGDESIFTHGRDGDDYSDNADIQLLPGVSSLLAECVRDDTAIVVLLDQPTSSEQQERKKQLVESAATFKKNSKNLLHVLDATVTPPNPADLYSLVHCNDDCDDDEHESTTTNDAPNSNYKCLTIQPKGFGGSSGFGTKPTDPPRPPLPRHCVVLCTTIEQCRAARAVGMRCVSLTDNDIADAVILDSYDDGWQSITMDDICTPGSFWLNVCHERDDEGNRVDPVAIIKKFQQQQQGTALGVKSTINSIRGNINDEPSDDELAAILADMDPL
jgi:hypothetical protein